MGVSNSGSSWYNRTAQPGWMGSWGYPGATGSSLSPTGAGKSELRLTADITTLLTCYIAAFQDLHGES